MPLPPEYPGPCRVPWTGGLVADVLHDVDLAGVRPRRAGNWPPSIQKAGQMPWPARDLDPCLQAAELRLDLALGGQPGRGVDRCALAGGDDQVAVAVQGRVVAGVGVVLQLVVAPAASAGLESSSWRRSARCPRRRSNSSDQVRAAAWAAAACAAAVPDAGAAPPSDSLGAAAAEVTSEADRTRVRAATAVRAVRVVRCLVLRIEHSFANMSLPPRGPRDGHSSGSRACTPMWHGRCVSDDETVLTKNSGARRYRTTGRSVHTGFPHGRPTARWCKAGNADGARPLGAVGRRRAAAEMVRRRW